MKTIREKERMLFIHDVEVKGGKIISEDKAKYLTYIDRYGYADSVEVIN